MREEIGLTLATETLPPPVWTRDCLFTWKGAIERHLERFFLIRVSTRDADTIEIEVTEAGVERGHRWWNLEEIQASHDLFSPPQLAKHLAPLLEGSLPPGPVEVGE